MTHTRKAYAKVNVFLKVVGNREENHLIASRFVKVNDLYDTITFTKESCSVFTLEGSFTCPTQKNTIYKAYLKLCEISPKVQFYFKSHKVEVNKNIPEYAGLGGGSSNCAAFLIMVNEVCNLSLSKNDLASIGLKVGADVPFFIYEYESANVSGIGEVVEEFEEEPLKVSIYSPQIMCDTGIIYKTFREHFYKETSTEEQMKLFSMKSIDIFNEYDIKSANDLYESALFLESKLSLDNLILEKKHLFSGSGSSFFRINQ